MFVKLLATSIPLRSTQKPQTEPKAPLTDPDDGKLWITEHCEIVCPTSQKYHLNHMAVLYLSEVTNFNNCCTVEIFQQSFSSKSACVKPTR